MCLKKIAIDLDGVVFDSENLFRVYSEIYDIEKHGKSTLKDNTKRVYQERYTWNKDEYISFYNSVSKDIIMKSNLMPGADIVLSKLSKLFELIIVTARSIEEFNYTKEKLDLVSLDNTKVYTDSKHKIDIFEKEKVDYVIDDDEDICINSSSKGIKTLYFKNNASNRLNRKNVINVNNWGEIYKFLIMDNKKDV